MRSYKLLFIAIIQSGSPTGLEFTHNLTSEKDVTLLSTKLHLNLSIRPRGEGGWQNPQQTGFRFQPTL